MSVLYRATDIRLGRRVALKVIGEHLTGDPEFRERFVDEARNTSAVDHSNVVPLYDFGEVDGLLYIAMRLVDGSDLATLIAGGALSPPRAVALLSQVADALDLLHGKGLVHLDVKPANVLVTTKESAREHVYLADFGLTRRGATGHRTRGGDFLGSPTYAAPEHLRGEPVDGRTDVYSLACVLFACLTGRAPFRGEVQDVIAGHLTREVPAATSFAPPFAPGLPPAIDAVLHRGMAKSPDARYTSCGELIGAAQAVLAPGGRPPNPSHGGRPSVARYGWDGAVGAPPEPMRLRPPVPAANGAFDGSARPGADGRRWLVPAVIGTVMVLAIIVIVLLTGGGGDSGQPRPAGPHSIANVPVGPSGTSTGGRPLPTVLPTVPPPS